MDELQFNWKYYQSSSVEQQQKDWAGSLKKIGMVKNITELLYTLDGTEKEGLDNFLDMNFFKQDIVPMWEDPHNIAGGRIMAEIPHHLKDKLIEFWKKTIVFCVLEPYKGINGCVYADKANYRISIWIADSNISDDIINAWKGILNNDEISYTFSPHSKFNDSSRNKKKGGSYNKKESKW